MARLAQEIPRRLKFTHTANGLSRSVRHRNRCALCGRPRGYLRKFQMCRICFRNLALAGQIAGVVKASW